MENDVYTNALSVTNYAYDVEKYLMSKLPELPTHVRSEIVAYIGHRTCILLRDTVEAVNHEWQRSMKLSHSKLAK